MADALGIQFLILTGLLVISAYWLTIFNKEDEEVKRDFRKGIGLAFLAILIYSLIRGTFGYILIPASIHDMYSTLWILYITLLAILVIANYFNIKPLPVSLGIATLSLPALIIGISVIINYSLFILGNAWIILAGAMIIIISITGLISPLTVRRPRSGLVYLSIILLLVGAALSLFLGIALQFKLLSVTLKYF